MPIRFLRLFTVVAFALLAFTPPAAADSLVSLMGWPYDIAGAPGLEYASPYQQGTNAIPRRVTKIVYPVVGLPALVTRGQTLTVLVQEPEEALEDVGLWRARLVTAFRNRLDDYAPVGDAVGQEYDLDILSVTFDAEVGIYTLRCQVSAQTPTDIFAIHVSNPAFSDIQPAAVRVREPGNTIRFVHLANAKTADPFGQDEDNELSNRRYPNAGLDGRSAELLRQEVLNELALLRPDFAVFGGDLVWGGDYAGENDDFMRVVQNTQTPLFMQPGNHDGYAWFNGNELKEDGLEFYARSFGPPYYSFDVDEFHFVCLNSYDGAAARRQYGRLILALPADNKGGFLSEAQLAWLAEDLAVADAAGQTTLLFMHHDPRGPYTANRPFGTESWDSLETEAWNMESPQWDSNTQDGIANESEQYNTGVRLLQLALDYNVSHVFIANYHADKIWTYGPGEAITDRDGNAVGTLLALNDFTVVQTTTATAGVTPDTGKLEYDGYRVVELADGDVTSLNYLPGALQSVPAGNLWSRDLNNNGDTQSATVEVTNGLPEQTTVNLELYLAPAPAGYKIVRSDTLQAVPIADFGIGSDGQVVLYAKATIDGIGGTIPAAVGGEVRVVFTAQPHAENLAPAARLSASSDDGITWIFDAADSVDPDGADLRYFWNFGDGYTGLGPQTTHTYTSGGATILTLTVLDENGGWGLAKQVLDVDEINLDTDHDDEEDLCGECGATSVPDRAGVFLLIFVLGSVLWLRVRSGEREEP